MPLTLKEEQVKFLVEGLAFLGREMHLMKAQLSQADKSGHLCYHALNQGLTSIQSQAIGNEELAEVLYELRTTYLEKKH